MGTPAIHISTSASLCGNFEELERKYGLLFACADDESTLSRVRELVDWVDCKEEWQLRLNRLLEQKIDVTEFLVATIERLAGQRG